jgi:DNA (cytosine-5)-methyltransferase 1
MINEKIKFIDLFCGIGGFRLGLQQALSRNNLIGECILSSDIKKSAIETYQLNFEKSNIEDVRKINTSELGSFDFLLAGFPCQAFSSAGKRLGFEDTRGTLFFEVARILNDIKPKCFILENVEGLINHNKGNTLSTILAILDQIGYDFSWKLLNSKNFGLAQGRKRIYIAGVRKDLNLNLQNIFDFSTNFKAVTFKDIRDYNLETPNSKLNFLLKSSFNNLNLLAGKSINDKRGGYNNIHSWDLGIKGSITPKQKELINSLIVKRRNKKWSVENGTSWFDGIPLSLNQIKTFMDYENLENDLNALTEKGYLKQEYLKDYKIINNVKTKIKRTDLPMGYTLTTGKLSFEFSKIIDDNNIIPTIVATDSTRLGVIENTGLRKLSHSELKKLFGFPLTYKTNHLTTEEIFDLFGNSVTVNVIEEIANNLIKLITKQ